MRPILVLDRGNVSTRAFRLRRWAIIVASAFALYNLIGFLVVPPIVRSQIAQRAGAALDREVQVERVRMNPLSFAIAVHGLRVVDRDGADLASLRELYINADPLASLFKLEWHLAELRLVEPRARLIVDEAGQANVADLITRYSAPASEPKPDSGGLPRAGADEVRVERAAVEFADRSRPSPFHTVIGPMTFALERFTTRPDAASPYTFSGTTDTGESFSWSGSVSAAPLGSQGHVEFTGFSIPKHMPFVEAFFPGSVGAGTVSFKGDYRVGLAGTLVALLENATLAVDNVSVSERGAADALVKVGHAQVDIARADAVQRTAEIPRVAVDGLEVYATREAGGAIDLLRLIPAAPEAKEPATVPSGPAADPGPAPSAHVATLALTNGRISVVDRSNPRTARLLLDQIAVTATNLGTDLDREVGLEMSARWNERGSLTANGMVRALPTAARLEVKGGHIDLAPFDPLLAPFVDVRIKSGDVWFAGDVEAALAADGTPSLTWRGDAGLDTLSVCDEPAMSELVGWKRLAFAGTEFTLAPLAVSAREIALVEPAAHLVMREDGSINLLAVLRQGAPAGEPVPAEAAAITPAAKTSERLAAATRQKLDFDARIDAVTITDGRVSVTDHSFKPGFSTELRAFTGSIRGLSSANLARADVDLSGSLDGVSPLKISGQINPLADDVYSDVSVVFSNIDLPVFSPYSGRFIGQKIQKGKLRIDVGYKLSQRDLAGENRILFDQFYLGEKVQSAEAIRLPVGLALALLRDRNGQISLDVPVRGNLDDPDFKYGRVVWQTLGNILVKAATSPFSLLGGMFGGRNLDLSNVDFASGSTALTQDAVKKLEVLTKALFERPALRLEIVSPPAPSTDRAGLVAQKFAQMLRDEKQRLAMLSATPATPAKAGEPAPAPAPVPPVGEVAPEEVNALIASLFVQRFPAEAESGAAAAAAAGVTPLAGTQPAAEERPGFLRRAWRTVFGSDDGSRTASEPAPAPAAGVQPGTPDVSTAPAPLTLEAMRDRLIASIEVSDEEFAALARARAAAIRDAILAGGQVEAERVFLIDSTTVPEGATGSPDGGRVFFTLQ